MGIYQNYLQVAGFFSFFFFLEKEGDHPSAQMPATTGAGTLRPGTSGSPTCVAWAEALGLTSATLPGTFAGSWVGTGTFGT